jgi:hypothetical protein
MKAKAMHKWTKLLLTIFVWGRDFDEEEAVMMNIYYELLLTTPPIENTSESGAELIKKNLISFFSWSSDLQESGISVSKIHAAIQIV